MADISDPNSWSATFAAEWGAVNIAPHIFFGALFTLVLVGWLFWKFWYKHEISNLKSDVQTAKSLGDYWKVRFDAESAQHNQSKKTFAGHEPQLALIAKEVAAIPELRTMVALLARGEKIETPVDPSKPPEKWPLGIIRKINPAAMKTIALLANTSGSGVSTTSSPVISIGPWITTGTNTSREVQKRVEEIARSDDDENKD